MKRRLLRTLVVFVVLVEVVLPLGLYGLRSQLMFFPSSRPEPAQVLDRVAGDGVDACLVTAVRPDGRRLVGFDARPSGAPDAPVILYFHGNAGNAATRAHWLHDHVRAMGVRVVLASYSGYGGNEGTPSAEEVATDALAWFDHLVAGGGKPQRIVVHGRSMGGAAACAVAAKRKFAGVILQSAFSSLRSMAWRNYGWLPLACLLTGDEFDNAGVAAGLDIPLLIVHGTADRVVPIGEGAALAAAAPSATFIRIEGGDHNGLDEFAGEALQGPVRELVRRATR